MSRQKFTDLTKKDQRILRAEYKKIGAEFKVRRKEMGFTQQEVAEKLDVSIEMIKGIERGTIPPSLGLFVRLSNLLNMRFVFQRE